MPTANPATRSSRLLGRCVHVPPGPGFRTDSRPALQLRPRPSDIGTRRRRVILPVGGSVGRLEGPREADHVLRDLRALNRCGAGRGHGPTTLIGRERPAADTPTNSTLSHQGQFLSLRAYHGRFASRLRSRARSTAYGTMWPSLSWPPYRLFPTRRRHLYSDVVSSLGSASAARFIHPARAKLCWGRTSWGEPGVL